MERGACRAIVHGVAKPQTQLSEISFLTQPFYFLALGQGSQPSVLLRLLLFCFFVCTVFTVAYGLSLVALCWLHIVAASLNPEHGS